MSRRRSITIAAIAAVIAIAIGIVISFLIHWFPPQASTQAKNTDRLFHVLVIASIPIFVLVVTVILYSVWQFRMRPGEELKDGPPIHGNTRLEVFWTAIPTVLLLGLVGYSFAVLKENEQKPAGKPEIHVQVYGQQFAWSYEYPSAVTGAKPLRSTQLYVPEGTSVMFDIHSEDVIHAFWIPAFRIQEDAVPGITTSFRATPDRVGTYPVICNQLCGYGHSTMRTTLHILSASAWSAFLANHGYSGSKVQTASDRTTPTTAPATARAASAAPATKEATK